MTPGTQVTRFKPEIVLKGASDMQNHGPFKGSYKIMPIYNYMTEMAVFNKLVQVAFGDLSHMGLI